MNLLLDFVNHIAIQVSFLIPFILNHRSSFYLGGHGRSDLYFICRLSALTDAINMDRNEVIDCKWMSLDEALHVKNPLLQRIAKQLIFGLEHGFAQSIDMTFEQIPSIVTGLKFDIFTRPLKSNE